MVLPKLSFVLRSFLPYRVGDDLQYMCYGFGNVSAVEAGSLFMLFFVWNDSQILEELEAKRSVMIQCVKVTHPLLYQ